MSIATERWPLAKAAELAARLVDLLGPACERIEVAGSIRRRKADVGDVEIVAVPRMVDVGLFPGAAKASALDDELDRLARQRPERFRRIKGGDKYKTYCCTHRGDTINLDLWITTAAGWGVTFAIKTGNAEFSNRLVTPWSKHTHGGARGFLRDGLRVSVASGRVYREADVTTGMIDATGYSGPVLIPHTDAVPFDTPQERDFFALTSVGWIDPEQRG